MRLICFGLLSQYQGSCPSSLLSSAELFTSTAVTITIFIAPRAEEACHPLVEGDEP